MTNTPSPDEDRELIEHMDVLLAGFAGENDLRVGPHMLAEGVKKGRDRLESLLADRAKLEEALGNVVSCGCCDDELRAVRHLLNRSTDRGCMEATSDPAVTHNQLWNELVQAILEFEDSYEMSGDLARRIIQIVGRHVNFGN